MCLFGLQRHLLVLLVEALPIRRENFPLRSALPTVCFRLRVGSRNSSSLPDNFGVPSATGNMNSSPFRVINTSFTLTLRG